MMSNQKEKKRGTTRGGKESGTRSKKEIKRNERLERKKNREQRKQTMNGRVYPNPYATSARGARESRSVAERAER